MWDLHRSSTSGHVFSPAGDALTFLAPVVVCFLALPFLYALVPEDRIPLWAYVVVVALTDVGHVWTTLFRCYLDSEENRRRPLLYNGTPLAMLALSFSLHYFVSEGFFWTLLGYLAIFHFVRQQYGFLMLAKRRGRDVQHLRRDAAFLYAGAVIPIVLWHMDHTRRFDWFNRDDQFLHAAVGSAGAKVLTTVSASVAGAVAMLMNSKNDSSGGGGSNSTNGYLPLGRWSSRLWMQEQHEAEGGGCNGHDCYDNARIPSGNANWGDFSATTIALYLAAFTVMLVVVVAREQLEMARRRSDGSSKVFPFYSTKHMILVGTWITWAFGVLCPHRVVSLAFLNLFHAAPTFLVTFCAAFNRWLLWCRHAAERSKFIAARWRAGSNGFARDDEEGNDADGKRGKNVGAAESTATTCDPTESCSALDRFALWMLLSSVDGGKNTPFMNKRGGGGSAAVSSPSAPSACSVSFAVPSNEAKRNSNGNGNKRSATRTKLLCFCVFLAFLFLLGLAEEYLWETLIWHDYTEELWEFDPAEDFSPPVYSAITALLILPQATHYFLDAFLWKHAAEENPGLALHLGMETARPVPQEWLDMMAT